MATFIKRGKSWQAQVRRKGAKPISKSFRTKAMAQDWARKIEDEMVRGVHIDTREASKMTVGDLLDWYMAEIVPLNKSQAFHLTNCRTIKADDISRLTLDLLSPSDVLEYVKRRRSTITRLGRPVETSTVRKEVNTLAKALTSVVTLRGIRLHSNPVNEARQILGATKVLTPPSPRRRRLEGDEEGRLLNAMARTKEAKFAVLVALASGLRLSEIIRIRREQIIRRNGLPFLDLPDTKTGRGYEIPLAPVAAEILEALPVSVDGRLFRNRPDSISQAFARATRRAGIADLRFHDLRREALTRLFERGYTVPEVMAISHHEDPATLLKVYTAVENAKVAKKLSSGRSFGFHKEFGNRLS